MTEPNLSDIRARHAAATQGPWMAVGKSVRVAGSEAHFGCAPTGAQGTGICNCLGQGWPSHATGCNEQASANADFIAHSWQDEKDLLALLEECREAMEEQITCCRFLSNSAYDTCEDNCSVGYRWQEECSAWLLLKKLEEA